MTTGVELIAEERQRQIEKEGWTPEHDDEHDDGQLALAAMHYAAPDDRSGSRVSYVVECLNLDDEVLWCDALWPWGLRWDKKGRSTRIRDLVKAGALIAAEIDRLQRLEGEEQT